MDVGQSQIIVLSLGECGALLITKGEGLRAEGVDVKVKSTVGAANCLLAGPHGGTRLKCGDGACFPVRDGGGRAAPMTRGTALCQTPDVKRLLERVTIVSM